MKADKTLPSPEIDQLMVELGNTAKAIPFYVIYPAGGGEPKTVGSVLLTQNKIIDLLKEAKPTADETATAMSD